ncbi:MAG TPA: PadR family transcriptional regulator [Gemmatimonadaceae bacterium]|jgi:DNA-binding PadR family transcriptional regulator|nr:PadR family transcriptional regulator [Gemmatimonadaceae bacterium]
MQNASLGELEFVVLLVVSQTGDDAYGAAIRREVSDRTRREYSVGAIYATLRRLEHKGLVKSFESEPLPVRGGRSRRYFVPTNAGRLAVRRAVQAKRSFWTNLTTAPGRR